MKSILSADIGGTNSRFAHFTVDAEGKLSLAKAKWLRTRESGSFGDLLRRLTSEGFSLRTEEADVVVIAIAGPVQRGVYSAPPYIPWDIDLSDAGVRYGFRRWFLINDFVAQAFACRTQVGEAARRILPGKIVRDAALAVIGAGTALGQAALKPDGRGGFVAVPSEGGHANFPFVTAEECRLQEFLMKELGEGYITASNVVSGKGLSRVHRFLTGELLDPEEVAEKFSSAPETLAWAARFYGRACRNYALAVVALGGVYIAGGVAAKEPMLLTHKEFGREFRSSPTLAALLKEIPVFLITDEESGLWGAAFYGRQHLLRNP